MSPLQEIAILIVGTLGSLYLTIIMLRFLFQVVRANFYNPVSQFIVKATNPLLLPLRKIIPGVGGLDLASLILALLFHWLIIQLLAFAYGAGVINPLNALIWAFVGLISLTLNIFFVALLVMIIASWIAPMSHHPILILIHQLVEPAMAPFRKIIPPLGGLDITPIFAFLAIQVCRVLLGHFAQSVALPPAIVLGI
ncbi:YggT family protein [Gilvimarinus sp. F26214L]|uniref:YggT family protein n=1 Tax=Gilvimarinus sp. DZF01 TaxID=3461371 RepID=UPI00404635F4